MNNSIIFQNSTVLTCTTLRLVGIYMLILMIFSLLFNSINLIIYKKTKLFTPVNCIMISLIFLNISATFLDAPKMIYDGFNCISNHSKCTINSFLMHFCGTLQTFLLVSISVQRFISS